MHYALKKGYKMVVHVHGGLFLTAPRIPFILEKILKWVFAWDVPFIVLSEGEKEILQSRFGAKRVEVLPNCPDIPVGMYDTLTLRYADATIRSVTYETPNPNDNPNSNLNDNDNLEPLNDGTLEPLLRAYQWSLYPSRSPRYRGAETPEHLLERKNY